MPLTNAVANAVNNSSGMNWPEACALIGMFAMFGFMCWCLR